MTIKSCWKYGLLFMAISLAFGGYTTESMAASKASKPAKVGKKKVEKKKVKEPRKNDQPEFYWVHPTHVGWFFRGAIGLGYGTYPDLTIGTNIEIHRHNIVGGPHTKTHTSQ